MSQNKGLNSSEGEAQADREVPCCLHHEVPRGAPAAGCGGLRVSHAGSPVCPGPHVDPTRVWNVAHGWLSGVLPCKDVRSQFLGLKLSYRLTTLCSLKKLLPHYCDFSWNCLKIMPSYANTYKSLLGGRHSDPLPTTNLTSSPKCFYSVRSRPAQGW